MALSIRSEEVDRLARELAGETGETMTEAIRKALQERLERVRRTRGSAPLADEIARLQKRVATLPVLDERSPEEVLGYDPEGLPS